MNDFMDPEAIFEKYWRERVEFLPEIADQKQTAAHAFYASWILYGQAVEALMKDAREQAQ